MTHSIYQKTLNSQEINNNCFTPQPDSRDSQLISVQIDKYTFQVLLDNKHHVKEFRVFPVSEDTEKRLYTCLSEAVIGRSLQDCAEHSIIRLENSMRELGGKRPALGITQPENADPIFSIPQKGIRLLFKTFVDKTGYVRKINEEDETAAPSWILLSVVEKIAKLIAIIPEVESKTSIKKTEVLIVKIEYDVKITIDIKSVSDAENQNLYLNILEKLFKEKIDNRLEIFLLDKKDKNPKRIKKMLR